MTVGTLQCFLELPLRGCSLVWEWESGLSPVVVGMWPNWGRGVNLGEQYWKLSQGL